MNLSDLYSSLDTEGRERLAKRAGIAPGYLWQIATQWRGRKPSLEVIGRLVSADKRLKAEHLISEFASRPTKEASHA